jgi:hypothetical protein
MVLNLRKPLNLALLCYECIVWVLTEIALVPHFALEAAVTRFAGRNRHGVRYDQAMLRGHMIRRLGSYCTRDKTGEDEGEDGCVDEKFHDWLPPGGWCYVFVWNTGTIKSIVRKIRERVFLSTYRGYLLSPLLKYPSRLS